MSTDNLALHTPANGDPSVRNSWASLVVNPNMVLIDAAVAGSLTKSVAGSANVVLSQTEATHSAIIATGVLTGNIYLLFPQGIEFNFSVQNTTTGAFTLSVGANNGSSAPAGDTVLVPQDGTCQAYRSDGTDAFSRGGSSLVLPLAVASGGTGGTDTATARSNLAIGNFANTGSGARTLTIQSGGGPSGGNDGDVFFVY